MNKTISIIRIAILAMLGSIAMVLLFCEEQGSSVFEFFFRIILDKALGIAFCFYLVRLWKRWSRVDGWLKAYATMLHDVMQEPT